MKKGKLLTVGIVSKRLSCSISSVYRLIEYGDLSAVRTGPKKGLRVPEKKLDDYLTRNRTI